MKSFASSGFCADSRIDDRTRGDHGAALGEITSMVSRSRHSIADVIDGAEDDGLWRPAGRIERRRVRTGHDHAVFGEILPAKSRLLSPIAASSPATRSKAEPDCDGSGICDEIAIGLVREISPFVRSRCAALRISGDRQSRDTLRHVMAVLQEIGNHFGIGRDIFHQEAALVHVLRRPARGDHDIRLRIGFLRLETGHHLPGPGLEDVDGNTGFGGEGFSQRIGEPPGPAV